MAGLDVSDRLRPQDGRAKLRVGSAVIGLRVSTLPARNGEKVVLRILNERAIQAKLPQLGFHPGVRARCSAILALVQGMVLVTGPTGSGKTTTLYHDALCGAEQRARQNGERRYGRRSD